MWFDFFEWILGGCATRLVLVTWSVVILVRHACDQEGNLKTYAGIVDHVQGSSSEGGGACCLLYLQVNNACNDVRRVLRCEAARQADALPRDSIWPAVPLPRAA